MNSKTSARSPTCTLSTLHAHPSASKPLPALAPLTLLSQNHPLCPQAAQARSGLSWFLLEPLDRGHRRTSARCPSLVHLWGLSTIHLGVTYLIHLAIVVLIAIYVRNSRISRPPKLFATVSPSPVSPKFWAPLMSKMSKYVSESRSQSARERRTSTKTTRALLCVLPFGRILLHVRFRFHCRD